MEDYVAVAEAIVVKWDPHASASAKLASLFHGDHVEALTFLTAVCDLHHAMLFLAFGGDAASVLVLVVSSHTTLIRTQTPMKATMCRIKKEFY